VVYYSQVKDNPVVAAHLQQGARAVYVHNHHVVLARGNQENELFHLDLPMIARLLHEGIALPTLLASVAAAWALDITPLLIRAGLKNFGQQQQVAKDTARMNG